MQEFLWCMHKFGRRKNDMAYLLGKSLFNHQQVKTINMNKKIVIASAFLLCIFSVNAQDTTARTGQNTQTNNTNTTNKKGNKSKNQTNTNQSGTNQTSTNQTTNTNQGNGTTTGDAGMNSQTSGNQTDASGGQMTSTGRYAAMGIKAGSLHAKDVKFVTMANSSNTMELQLSQLALQKASSQSVKDFAKMMVDHHSMAGQEMKTMLSAKGATIPDSAMLSRHRMNMEMLQPMQGADFDKAYMRIMVDAHEEDVDEYEDETTDARDADIRTFATRMLPILRQHYAHSKEVRKQVK